MNAEEFAKQVHKGQIIAENITYWPHLHRVVEIIKEVMGKAGETSETILDAAWLHDSVEDTTTTIEQIKEKFGEKVAKIVWELTDEENNIDTTKYLEKIKSSSEEARLIKLADLFDNITGVIYRINHNGIRWTKELFVPKVIPMFEAMIVSEFTKFPKSAVILKEKIKLSKKLLFNEIEDFSHD